MSQENVEIVRRWFDAYAARGLDAIREFATPDFELVPSVGSVRPVTMRLDEAFESTREWTSSFEDFHAAPTDFIDAGDQVLVALEERGTPRGGGIELHQTWYMVYTLWEDKIVRVAWFGDRSEALRAVGLEE